MIRTLSALFSGNDLAEIQVTGAVTAKIGRMHVCSGTSADYTVTLPPVAGNAGKLLGIRMSSALTKLVTIDGNAAETIDGAAGRIMWAGESAILLCDGASWSKIAGKSIPFFGLISPVSINQLFNASAFTKLLCNTFYGDAHLSDVANNNLIIRRPGAYTCTAAISYNNNNATAGTNYVAPYINAALHYPGYVFTYRAASAHYQAASTSQMDLAAGDLVSLYAFFIGGSFTTSSIQNDANSMTKISLSEIVKW